MNLWDESTMNESYWKLGTTKSLTQGPTKTSFQLNSPLPLRNCQLRPPKKVSKLFFGDKNGFKDRDGTIILAFKVVFGLSGAQCKDHVKNFQSKSSSRWILLIWKLDGINQTSGYWESRVLTFKKNNLASAG